MTLVKKNIDLLNGNILASLTELALPIMATSLVQTAYNLTDMAWIGMVGSDAVAAVGAAAMYTWLSSGVATLARMGGQVKSAHAYGEGNRREAVQYGKGALQLALVLAAVYGIITNLFAGPLIGFFHLNSFLVVEDAIVYLRIACGLILFAFIGQTLTGLYTASGNSRTPFVANCIGMGANIVLDPLLIFGLGPIPGMGVAGAAVATVIAQFIVSLVLVISMRKEPVLAAQMRIWIPTPLSNIKTMVRIGFPAAIQSMLYCVISMVLTRFVTAWGDTAVAVQRVGGQIESISWMTADGFGTAINAFVGQNYGAGNLKRVKKGYMTASVIMFIWGIFTTCLLIFGAAPIFSLFIHEPEVIPAGADYLRIIGFSEMFMCVELMTVGALSGMGKTMEASVITIILTAARIPLAVILGGTALGLNGIWWALTISSIVKGIIFFVYYLHIMKRMKA
uniref:MATE family efflux transporter n=1 Tax=Enterocloster clostridioformis TaxID=1531 RepID=UPI0026EDA2EE|nr:MATE family efflux transporter [Enterocloster clostridioformis]